MKNKLIEFKNCLVKLFFEYMRTAVVVMFLAVCLGFLVTLGNKLLDLESTILKLQLESCRAEQNIGMVSEAMEKRSARIDRAQFAVDALKSERTFTRQMQELDRIEKNIDNR